MSWTDSDGLERGGACNECGADVEEEHHAFCADCFAEQNGWTARSEHRPDPAALRWQRADRERTVTTLLIARIDDLDRRVGELERVVCAGTAI